MRLSRKTVSYVLAAIMLAVAIAALSAPLEFFEGGAVIYVPRGATLDEVAQKLKEQRVIGSALLLKGFVEILGDGRQVKSGIYNFEEPQGTFAVARRLLAGDGGLHSSRLVIPEGSSAAQIAALVQALFPDFDAEAFMLLAKDREGYLFPDTYEFSVLATPESVIETLSANFERRVVSIEDAVAASGRTLPDIVIMASILEKEVRAEEDMRTVSGILWKRLDEGMPLQVDAPFAYILGKTSAELTQDDLALDSPYNTYANRGLPPAPISNPGLTALRAAAMPAATPYWFYLTDEEGAVYYAETFEEHIENKKKYLESG